VATVIYYYYDDNKNGLARERFHNKQECIVIARLTDIPDVKWMPAQDISWAKSRLNQIKPCLGCGKPIV
jgi:hypothetical protein